MYRAKGSAAALGLISDGSPLVAGNEPCGVVAAVGQGVSKSQATVGDRVMDHHYSGCGVCKHCRKGWSQMCLDGNVVFGATAHRAHAKYMKVPAHTLGEITGCPFV